LAALKDFGFAQNYPKSTKTFVACFYQFTSVNPTNYIIGHFDKQDGRSD
jgi:hypothetical protein